MAYDQNLAERVRAILASEPSLSERKMFGGIAFMIEGHMCCGIVGHDLMLRLGPDGCDAALKRPHVRPMDFTGRPDDEHGIRGAGGAPRRRAAALDRESCDV